LVAALFASALLAPNAGAKVHYPRLDPSFGSGGYVLLPEWLPGPQSEKATLQSLAAAPGGAAYATETSLIGNTCNTGKCEYRSFLARVNSDGSIATTFGGGGRLEVASGLNRLGTVTSDAQGRALVVTLSGSSITVHRYLADGTVDNSFGGGTGATTFDCGCGSSALGYRPTLVALDGRERLVVSYNTAASGGGSATETLARLLPDGGLDSGFGSDGIVQLGPEAAPNGISFGSNDAVYLWGQRNAQAPVFLNRVSAKGRIDSTFDARVDQTLTNIVARGVLRERIADVVVRPHGLLDLYGGEKLLRLRSAGTVETKFGHSGVRSPGWSGVIDAMLVGNGKTLGLSWSGDGVSLFRTLANGRPDPSFGSSGARLIEGVSLEEELSLAHLNGRRAQILNLGVNSCRFSCGQTPSLVRYRIGPKG
jgi:uncharacterized delta-60 repeat protein